MTFWQRFLEALKVNRAPVLDPADQAKLDQQAKLNRLYPKKP